MNSDSACIQGKLYLNDYKVINTVCSDIKSNTKWRRVLQCIVFSSLARGMNVNVEPLLCMSGI